MNLAQPSDLEGLPDVAPAPALAAQEVKAASPAAQLFMGAAALLMAGGATLLQMVRRQNPKLAEKPRYTWNMAATAGGERETWVGMAGNNLKDIEYGVIAFIGTSLAAVAGFVNAATLLSVLEQTPSHVTGITTKAAIALVTGDPATGTGCLIAGLQLFGSFVLGAMTTGFLARGETWKLGNRYGLLLLIESAALWCGYGMYYNKAWQTCTMLVNAYACGLQNAMTTRWSGAVIRTTHVTGSATDIGTALANWLRFGSKAPDTWRLGFLIPLTLGFFLGGVGATLMYLNVGYQCVAVPASWLAGLGLAYMWLKKSDEDKQPALASA
jgi:uncharacterized membrane protein YoaK (UPF0700 family)